MDDRERHIRKAVEDDPSLRLLDESRALGRELAAALTSLRQASARGRLRGYGNAIVPQVAAEVVRAYMEASPAVGGQA